MLLEPAARILGTEHLTLSLLARLNPSKQLYLKFNPVFRR